MRHNWKCQLICPKPTFPNCTTCLLIHYSPATPASFSQATRSSHSCLSAFTPAILSVWRGFALDLHIACSFSSCYFSSSVTTFSAPHPHLRVPPHTYPNQRPPLPHRAPPPHTHTPKLWPLHRALPLGQTLIPDPINCQQSDRITW